MPIRSATLDHIPAVAFKSSYLSAENKSAEFVEIGEPVSLTFDNPFFDADWYSCYVHYLVQKLNQLGKKGRRSQNARLENPLQKKESDLSDLYPV